MSPIGRIFIVVNLVLAVVFLGWASANLSKTEEYKALYEAEQAAKAQLDEEKSAEISGLTTDLNQKTNDNTSLVRDKAELDAQRTRLDADLVAEKAKNAELMSRLEGVESRLGDLDGAVEKASSEASDANERAMAATEAKVAAENAQVDAEERADDLQRQLDEAQDSIASLEVSINAANKQIADLDTALTVAKEQGFDPGAGIVQPLIDGAVMMVSYDINPGIVLINRGSADGVRRGQTFDVYSGNQYKARVRVTNVHENSCSAVVEKAYEGRSIAQGDSASTRI